MYTNISRRLFATAAALVITVASAWADNQTKTDHFELTRGDFTELSFKPGAAGTIKLNADFRGTGVVRKEIAVRMQLLRPDGSVAKEVVGGSPLPLSFTLSAAEFEQNKGKSYKAVVRHTVAGQDGERLKGTLTATFPIGTVTVLNTTAPIDLAGEGAKTEQAFNIPNQTGKLEVTIAFRNGAFDTKKLIAQLIRADGVSVTANASLGTITLTRNVSQADLEKGRRWTVRLTNNNNLAVRGIQMTAKFTPN